MDAKQYAWVYLLEHGQPGEPSYYGGSDYPDEWHKRFQLNRIDGHNKMMDSLLKDIRQIGVDWTKTQEPQSDLVSRFTDTFHEPEQVETLIGWLVLRDGSEQPWYADRIDVSNVFKMLAMGDEIKDKFTEYFGKNYAK